MCDGTRTAQSCHRCGEAFTPSKFAFSLQRFCSKRCADVWAYEHSQSKRLPCECKVCGKQYQPKTSVRTTCCSQACGRKWSGIQRKGTRSKVVEAREVAERLRRLYERLKTCNVCGLAFHAKQPSQMVCGDECRKVKAAKPCATCDKPRVRVGANLSPYCEECRKEVAKVSRKQARWARDRRQTNATAKYQSKELLLLLRGLVRRAKGQCRLCGLAMSKRCDPSSDRALEFDHKIPLCKGGPDTVKNLQAICRRCNGLKGTFTSPEIVLGALLT
jgi:hypothetical protein